MNGKNEVFSIERGGGGEMNMVRDRACRGSEVPLRALWCKAAVGVGLLGL